MNTIVYSRRIFAALLRKVIVFAFRASPFAALRRRRRSRSWSRWTPAVPPLGPLTLQLRTWLLHMSMMVFHCHKKLKITSPNKHVIRNNHWYLLGLIFQLSLCFHRKLGVRRIACAGRSRARALCDWRGVCGRVPPRAASCAAALSDPPYTKNLLSTTQKLFP